MRAKDIKETQKNKAPGCKAFCINFFKIGIRPRVGGGGGASLSLES